MAHFQVIVAKIIFNVIILLVTTNFNLRIRVIIRARFIAPLHFFYLGQFKCLNKYLPILHTLLVSYLFPITFRFQRAALNAPRVMVLLIITGTFISFICKIGLSISIAQTGWLGDTTFLRVTFFCQHLFILV